MVHGTRVRLAASAAAATAAPEAASARPLLPIPSLAPKPPRRSALKAAATRAARRTRIAQQGFEVEGPRLTLREQEVVLRAEVADLERKLESTVQAESSKRATEHLPPLDELTLEQLYHALTLPEPLTPAEERLLLLDQRRSVKRTLGVEAPQAALLESPALQDRERVQLRMRALESRVAGIAMANDAELVQHLMDERDALADRVGELIAQSQESAAPEASQEHVAQEEVHDLPTQEGAPAELLDQHALHEAMSSYAKEGDVTQCQEAMRQMGLAGIAPTALTYHWLVKAHLRAGNTLVAMQTVTALEMTPTPPHVSTYTILIDHLINHPSSSRAVQSAAWSIFYHMRLAVHPIPDAPLYALMLHACAKGVPQPSDVLPISPHAMPIVRAVRKVRKPGRPDAERALDMFREMTVTYGITPNAEIYNNLILACCRSGERRYYHEAFRLLRDMLRKSEEASYADVSLAGILEGKEDASEDGRAGKAATLRFTPDRYTFHAFLQGCAKHGDLARARWVLAEMIRAAAYFQRALAVMGSSEGAATTDDPARLRHLKELDECRPSTETLVHVFYTYASYEPPVRRRQVKVLADGAGSEGTAAGDSLASKAEGKGSEVSGTISAPQTGNDAAAPVISNAPEQARTDMAAVEDEAASAFTLDLPQTSAEVLREVRALMARIVSDHESSDATEGAEGRHKSVLSTVRRTAQLLNAYLSAVLPHASPADRLAIFQAAIAPLPAADQAAIGEGEDPSSTSDTVLEYGSSWPEQNLFARLGLKPNSRTIQLGLDYCANVSTQLTGRPGDDLEQLRRNNGGLSGPMWNEVRQQADALWEQWKVLDEVEAVEALDSSRRSCKSVAISEAKRREKAWASRIRHLAKFDHLDDALVTLKEFAKIYPPHRAGRSLETDKPARKDKDTTKKKKAQESAANLPATESSQAPAPAAALLRVARTANAAKTASKALALPYSLLSGIGPLSVPPEAYNVLLSSGSSGRETSTSSQNEGPTMTGASPAAVTDAIRPGLTFTDLELLHLRLVELGGPTAKKGIALVTGVAKSYEAQKKESW
ncbi:hypothetical protein V8E36_006598 [Tilletia maclaganii]